MSPQDRSIDDLIAAHLQGEASEAETCTLFEWINSDPEHTKQFARAAMLHTQLREQLSGEVLARESGEFDFRSVRAASAKSLAKKQMAYALRRPQVWKAVIALSLVACFVVSVSSLIGPNGDTLPIAEVPIPTPDFATIVQAVDVDWSADDAFTAGDRVAATSFRFDRGLVRIRIDSGVEVTLEGPVEFELIAPDRASFHHGLLTSTVPPGAEGFRVDTPTTQVVDLGTAFGIRLDEEGVPEVSVFDGQVEVGLQSTDERQLLNEGESVRVDADNGITPIPIDVEAYEKIWPFSSGIVGSSGAFRFAPPWPRRLRLIRSDSDIFVVPERYAIELIEPLRVNVSAPGEYRNVDELTPDAIPSGSVVRSFLLHYHPAAARPPRLAEQVTGSITFDRPIRGLILLHDELRASALRFSPRRAGEAQERRQIELSERPIGDRVTLSEDRRTLTVDLTSPNETSDLLRVIVDASSFPQRNGL